MIGGRGASLTSSKAPDLCCAGSYQCVGVDGANAADDSAQPLTRPRCPGGAADGFLLSLAVQPRTFYFFAASPANQAPTSFGLSASATCLPPAGTWSAPAVVPSLPYTSEPICVSSAGFLRAGAWLLD